MRTSPSITSIAPAFVAFQAEVHNPAKDAIGENAEGKEYRYGSLPSLLETVRPPLTAHELSLTQDVASAPPGHELLPDGGVLITTRFIHSSGEWYEYGPLAVFCPPDPQSVGTATTYGKRTAAKAALGVDAGEDEDDGKAVSQASPSKRASASPQAGARPPAPPKPASKGRLDKIGELAEASGMDQAGLLKRVKNHWKHTRVEDLLMPEASTLIDELKAELAAKTKAERAKS